MSSLPYKLMVDKLINICRFVSLSLLSDSYILNSYMQSVILQKEWLKKYGDIPVILLTDHSDNLINPIDSLIFGISSSGNSDGVILEFTVRHHYWKAHFSKKRSESGIA